MATRKKAKKKSARSRKKSSAKKAPVKGSIQKRKARKGSARSKAAPKKSAAKKPPKIQAAAGKKKGTSEGAQPRVAAYPRESSGLQSGDFQGLSNVESADSESVNELLEEGNTFEAGIISGVEDSGRREGKEVRTRQVPEDDVPKEYLDEE